MKLIALRWEVC